MKKIYLSLLLPFAAIATCNAQQDMSFETGGVGANYVWNVFENDTNPPLEFVANPNPSGVNTSATVAKFTAMVSGQRYAGTETNHNNGMADFVLDADHSTIKIMVYKTVISPVGIKLVTQSGAALIEKKVSNTLTNQWEVLTFDFADYIGRLPDDNGMYDQIVVFPDFTDGPRAATNVIYFDNITFGESDITNPPAGPMTPAPDPVIAQDQVISLFSDFYTNNIPMTTWRTSWSEANHEDVMIQGNTTKKYSTLNFVGAEPVTQIDITGMTHFNFNVWSADFTQLRVKLVDFGANGQHNDATEIDDDVEDELTFNYTASDLNAWKTYHIAISDFADLTTRGHIAQIIFSSTNGSTVYMDNIFFSTDTVNSVTGFTANNVVMFPNPVKDVLTIKGASLLQQVSVYNTLGQQVYAITPNADTVTINVSQLQSGLYIVNTLVDGVTATQKFIKQ